MPHLMLTKLLMDSLPEPPTDAPDQSAAVEFVGEQIESLSAEDIRGRIMLNLSVPPAELCVVNSTGHVLWPTFADLSSATPELPPIDAIQSSPSTSYATNLSSHARDYVALPAATISLSREFGFIPLVPHPDARPSDDERFAQIGRAFSTLFSLTETVDAPIPPIQPLQEPLFFAPRQRLQQHNITVMTTADSTTLHPLLNRQLLSLLPEARHAHLKSGGEFPWLSEPDMFVMMLLVHLRGVGHVINQEVVSSDAQNTSSQSATSIAAVSQSSSSSEQPVFFTSALTTGTTAAFDDAPSMNTRP